jgi:hypothetical protein
VDLIHSKQELTELYLYLIILKVNKKELRIHLTQQIVKTNNLFALFRCAIIDFHSSYDFELNDSFYYPRCFNYNYFQGLNSANLKCHLRCQPLQELIQRGKIIIDYFYYTQYTPNY